MANQKDIDSSSEQITRIISTAKEELVAHLTALANQRINPFTGVKTLSRLADDIPLFADYVLGLDIETILKTKVQKAISVYAEAHRKVLESTIAFADVEANVLSAYATLNEQLLENSILRNISGHIRTEVISGAKAGLNASQIAERVTNSSISNRQMQTVVNTTLNTYSRAVTNSMMDNAPDNTKYVYIGPVDDRTRDECLDMASAGELTESQILSQYGEAVLFDGGGMNCRHKWEIASEEGTGFNQPKEGKRRFDIEKEKLERKKTNA